MKSTKLVKNVKTENIECETQKMTGYVKDIKLAELKVKLRKRAKQLAKVNLSLLAFNRRHESGTT